MAWTIKFDKRAFKELKQLGKEIQKRILAYLRDEIAIDDDPRRRGKPLTSQFKNLWRYRIGNFRIVCQIQDKEFIILVVSLGHRSTIYRKK